MTKGLGIRAEALRLFRFGQIRHSPWPAVDHHPKWACAFLGRGGRTAGGAV